MPATNGARPSAILSPGDPGWDAARRAWNLAVDQRPAAVAMPKTARDVAAAISFARERGLRVAAQSTGRSAAPLGPLADTVLVRTRAMRTVRIDPVAGTARAEAGALWREAADAAAEHGLAGLAGLSPSAGIVGDTLGGGLSWLGRRYGLSANNVEAFELVTADGELVRADSVSDPGLFWALRGGGGSFGVVTAVELRLFPIREVYAGQLWWPAEAGRPVLHAWRELTRRLPPGEFSTTVRYRNFACIPGTPRRLGVGSFCVVTAVHLGAAGAADKLLAPLRALGPLTDTMRMMPASELGHLHGYPGFPVPLLADGALLDDLPGEAADAIVELAGAGAGSPLFSVELQHLGGELARARADSGSLAALPSGYLVAAAGTTPDREATDAVSARIGAMRSALSLWTSPRMYLNLAGTRRDPAGFWSAHAYDRLRRIKAAVDPWNIIRANHAIPPAEQQARHQADPHAEPRR